MDRQEIKDSLEFESFQRPKNILHQPLATTSWLDYFSTSEGLTHLTILSIIALIIFRLLGPDDSRARQEKEEFEELWEKHENRLPNKSLKPKSKIKKLEDAPAAKLQRETIWIHAGLHWRVTKVTKRHEPLLGNTEKDGEMARSKLAGGDKYNHAIVTLHEICHNHRSCYGSFTPLLLGMSFFEDTVVYHIDFPGHIEDQSDSTEEDSSRPTNFMQLPEEPYTLDDLAAQLAKVIEVLDLQKFLAIGIGTGANVWVRYACENPLAIKHLMLIGVNLHRCSSREFTTLHELRCAMDVGGYSTLAKEGLAGMFFSGHASSEIRSYYTYLECLDQDAMRLLINATLERNKVPDERINSLDNIPTLLAMGNDSTGAFMMPFIDRVSGVMELQLLLPKQNTDILHVRGCGHIITEENPEEVLSYLKSFLRNFNEISNT